MRSTKPIRVVVIGAGIAGLTAALRLAERGFQVDVLEERLFTGGKLGGHRHIIRSMPVSEFTADGQSREISRKPYAQLTPLEQLARDAGQSINAFEQYLSRSAYKIESWIAKYLSTRSSLLCPRDRAAISVRHDSFKLQECAIRHGAEKCWSAIGKSSDGRDFCFNLALYRRGDQSLRVELSDDTYHEHCYHLFLNWYRNFWELMKSIRREKTQAFQPMNTLTHLFSGAGRPSARMRTLKGLSSISHAADNLLSGAEPIPDMLIWFYSAKDLVSHPLNAARYLDRTSVHGFMRSRWYASERGAEFHEHVLSKAFAVPGYYSSAYAYRRYLEYSLAEPEPMLWVLNNNCYDGMFQAFERALSDTKNCKLRLGVSVTGLHYGEANGTGVPDSAGDKVRINGLKFKFSGAKGWQQFSDDNEPLQYDESPEQQLSFTPDYVIVAIPPAALAELLNARDGNAPPIRTILPSLATVRKLQSGVIATLDLYFRRRLADVPSGHVVLRDSQYGLSFIDNSQIWLKQDPDTQSGQKAHPTFLNVVATDFYKIQGMSPDQATRIIIEDLKRFVDFDDADIDLTKTYLQLNDRDPLFLNEVGSEPWRPDTRTEIPNLFIAGDFADNEVGVVSVEGAVLSGLRAARAVQAQARVDATHGLDAGSQELREIPVLLPQVYPLVNAEVLKLMLSGSVGAAKAWSRAIELTSQPDRALSAEQLSSDLEAMLAMPGAIIADWNRLALSAAQWFAELPYADE